MKTKTKTTSKTRIAPDIKNWNLDYKAFIHSGGDATEFHGVQWSHHAMQRFMELCDLSQGPLKSEIETISRVRAVDVDDEGSELDNGTIKEWITYTITYSGKDFWGRKCVSPQITQGQYKIPTFETIVDWKISEDGQPVSQERSVPGEPRWKHTIPFSNSNIDKILKETGNESRKDEINYVCKFRINRMLAAGGERCGDYSYEQFVNSEFEHMRYLANRIGGPKGDHNLSRIDPAKVQNTCNCAECQKASKKERQGKGVS